MNEIELGQFLQTLHHHLNILKEREAKFGVNVPLELLNQIEDHQTAIALVESRLRGEISPESLLPIIVHWLAMVRHGHAWTYRAGTSLFFHDHRGRSWAALDTVRAEDGSAHAPITVIIPPSGCRSRRRI